jgi:hypothetical protein
MEGKKVMKKQRRGAKKKRVFVFDFHTPILTRPAQFYFKMSTLGLDLPYMDLRIVTPSPLVRRGGTMP